MGVFERLSQFTTENMSLKIAKAELGVFGGKVEREEQASEDEVETVSPVVETAGWL